MFGWLLLKSFRKMPFGVQWVCNNTHLLKSSSADWNILLMQEDFLDIFGVSAVFETN